MKKTKGDEKNRKQKKEENNEKRETSLLQKVAVDDESHIFVCDTNNSRVQVFSPEGKSASSLRPALSRSSSRIFQHLFHSSPSCTREREPGEEAYAYYKRNSEGLHVVKDFRRFYRRGLMCLERFVHLWGQVDEKGKRAAEPPPPAEAEEGDARPFKIQKTFSVFRVLQF